mgnify:CR=1 FL=1
MTFKNEKKKMEQEKEFEAYKGIVHLKHTGTELICDVIDEEDGIMHIQNPCILQSVVTEEGKSQMAMRPYLMTSKEDSIHISLDDILFIAECRSDIAEQHTQMFSSIALPKVHSKFAI